MKSDPVAVQLDAALAAQMQRRHWRITQRRCDMQQRHWLTRGRHCGAQQRQGARSSNGTLVREPPPALGKADWLMARSQPAANCAISGYTTVQNAGRRCGHTNIATQRPGPELGSKAMPCWGNGQGLSASGQTRQGWERGASPQRVVLVGDQVHGSIRAMQ